MNVTIAQSHRSWPAAVPAARNAPPLEFTPAGRGFRIFGSAHGDLLAAIVESSQDAIISKTLDGIITSWNSGARRLFGYEPVEAIGQSITLIIPPDRLPEEDAILARLRAGERIEHYETVRMTKHGDLVDVSITVSPVRDRRGRVIGASKVARDISERKQAEAVRRESERRKDEFLAILSHELRNPLTPLLTAAELMRRGKSAPDPQWLSELIQRQVRHMGRLIDDLLDVSRLGAGKVILDRQRIDLAPVLQNAIEANRALIDKLGHELDCAVPPRAFFVHADPARLAQVFSNLLNNAAKYTDAGGRIAVTAERDGSSVAIRVRDSGIGVAADQLGSIFGLYMQADDALARSRGGLGIGLTVARRLVELHHGSLSASSPGLGLGSEFTVRLPLAEDEAAPEGGRSAAPDVPARARRILIADGNADSAESLALLLRAAGHSVEVAHDGVAALAGAARSRPEVVLMDLLLPGLNGIEAARRLRQELGRDAMLIAITGLGQERHRQAAQEAGFDHHVLKPVEAAMLEALIARLR
ncbi:MAG TPA: PAS domain S-box protein [Nevskia sp.]|nr:PAS domain S-box protein [Nevskia sp.]